MDPRIEALNSTALFGKRLTRRQLEPMQATVELFWNDSRREPTRSICENLNWRTSTGSYHEQFRLRIPQRLEALGMLSLPPLREPGVRDLGRAALPGRAGRMDAETAVPAASGTIDLRLPVDCELHARSSARLAALDLLRAASRGEAAVRDRGYYACEVLL